MLTTVQVRPVDSTGTLEPTRGQPFDIGRGTDKHTPDLRKLLIGLCIGQIIMVSAIAAVLGFFVNSHVSHFIILNILYYSQVRIIILLSSNIIS